jgi:hypothetical protein
MSRVKRKIMTKGFLQEFPEKCEWDDRARVEAEP